MFTISHTTQSRRAHRPERRPRRGVALVFVLIFVIAMAALAMSSIFMASNANLLAKSYDRERDLKYAAEAALAIGKSRVNADPSILTLAVGKVDTVILKNFTITGADGLPLSGIKVNVYVGPTGSLSGQAGRFSSIVAEARDQRGNGFIRRLELTQESFAKFAYWSNNESNGSTTIFFNNHDELWGPVWSNDTISIGTGGAVFHDQVGTAFFISGASYGTYSKGYQQYQKPIPLPSTAALTNLSTIATSSGWNFTSAATASQTETSVRDRLEFVAVDLDGVNDSLDLNEGLFRIYQVQSGKDSLLRGNWRGTTPATATQCGDWHWARADAAAGTALGDSVQKFFPASVHAASWFRPMVKQGYRDQGYSTTYSDSASIADSVSGRNAAGVKKILTNPNARCYSAGDPHLVATDRATTIANPIGGNYTSNQVNKGGTDTTFTPVGVNGAWKANPATPAAIVGTKRPWDKNYLFPIDRAFNSAAKGVIYFTGNLAVSGTLNGRVTLYAHGSIVLTDDLRYANDPVNGRCKTDILGLLSDKDIVIADNAMNTPQDVGGGTMRALDDTKDMYIHAVMMALGTSFRVENYGGGPTNVNDCDVSSNGRGCIYLSGGLIQNSRGAVGTSSGSGFAKRYSYDHCAVVNPPPYFPTTGRFQENRYVELDPAGFTDSTYFRSIVP
ncbi:MAG: pilus assembly PilX N-terminal domain-containing protein [bacterium]